MRYRYDGKVVTVEDGEKVLVKASAGDRKAADDLRRTALRDGAEAITPEGLAAATKAEAAKEEARIEKAKTAAEPKTTPKPAKKRAKTKA